MLVGFISSDSYQSIFCCELFLGLFLIHSIQYETHLLTAIQVHLPNERAHSCAVTKAGLQRFVTSVITLNIKQIHFSRRDLLLLHSFFSKLLKLLEMTQCSVFLNGSRCQRMFVTLISLISSFHQCLYDLIQPVLFRLYKNVQVYSREAAKQRMKDASPCKSQHTHTCTYQKYIEELGTDPENKERHIKRVYFTALQTLASGGCFRSGRRVLCLIPFVLLFVFLSQQKISSTRSVCALMSADVLEVNPGQPNQLTMFHFQPFKLL